jgi:hypothetical protein
MGDVAFVAVMIGFFVLAWLFVAACDRIIGPDEEAFKGASSAEADQERAAA